MDEVKLVEKARRLEARFSLEIALWCMDASFPVDSDYRCSLLTLGRQLAAIATGVDPCDLDEAEMDDAEMDDAEMDDAEIGF